MRYAPLCVPQSVAPVGIAEVQSKSTVAKIVEPQRSENFMSVGIEP